jgi:LEA14-like dessication related protein
MKILNENGRIIIYHNLEPKYICLFLRVETNLGNIENNWLTRLVNGEKSSIKIMTWSDLENYNL